MTSPARDSTIDLRRRAESRLTARVNELPALSHEEIVRLVHELDVYRIELEMQNQELRESQQALEESRNRYADLYDFAPLAYVTLDAAGAVREANLAASALLETSRTSLENGRLLVSYVAPDDKARFRQHLDECCREKTPATTELRLSGRKGRTTHVQLRSVAVQSEDGPRFRTAITDITALKLAEGQLRKLNAVLEERVAQRTAEVQRRALELQHLAVRLTEVEEEERRRLAHVLHEGLQQTLFAARLALGHMRHRFAPDDAASIQQVEEMVGQAMGQSRLLVLELSPPVLYDGGLAPALEWLGRRFREQQGMQVAVEAAADVDPLPEHLRAFLFRAVSELLFNVVKHAGTDRASVTAAKRDDQVEIAVSDEGRGFDPAAAATPSTGGFGLFSIRERLELLGGKMTVETGPGLGTRVVLRAPRHMPGQRRKGRAVSHEGGAGGDGKIRLLMADDHEILRQGLIGMLVEEADIEVVGEAGNGLEALDLARQLHPDVVLMDVTMPVMDGIEATRRITAEMPGVRVIGLSMHEADHAAQTMLEAGARAYLSKGGPLERLLEAIREGGESRESRVKS